MIDGGDPDHLIRLAAFEKLRRLKAAYGGPIPWSALQDGFKVRGERFLFASAAEGIFRPRGMSGLLSIKTVVPKPKGRVWYHDQAAPELSTNEEVFWYAFSGSDPERSRNRWLCEAMERRLALVYFFGVAPGLYEPVFPTFVVDWNASRLSCGLSFSSAQTTAGSWLPPSIEERRYALRSVQQRLHQTIFRQRVLAAYGGRCALTNLPEPRLIDAAHIIPDGDDALGQPDLNNGVSMSKIHHAAFDAGLIGIDPDLKIYVAEHLLTLHDGPMLEQGLKALNGRLMRVPDDPRAAPDRDRLALRFKEFRAA